ncbi:uncharacterized protein LOC119399599 isoform X2 [Rhipicephalus sanguineus]|uniref:uncharacterized protein LOC119399599 isoform X2 n=1 Tax=Rhipicephalus sanguineus TaxID=34632 RepID=UPI00189608A7|nr:uncharacterized protein LOC119399599 isoform X2 [Rhipicephalus sanguineus]
MKLSFSEVQILVICIVCGSAKCCGEDRGHKYCRSSGPIPQLTCKGVQSPHCPLWSLKCACVAGKYLRSDSKCVNLQDCDKSEEAVRKKQQKDKEKREQQATDLYQKALQFVQRTEEIELVRIDLAAWIESDCVCVKSTFLANFLDIAERTLDCYLYADAFIVKNSVMQETYYVDFEVKRTKDDISITVAPTPAAQQEGSVELQGTYTLLGADADCIVVSFGDGDNGKHRCLMWGLAGDDNKKETLCFRALSRLCTTVMQDVVEINAPCIEYDEKHKRLDEKAKAEEHAQLSSED